MSAISELATPSAVPCEPPLGTQPGTCTDRERPTEPTHCLALGRAASSLPSATWENRSGNAALQSLPPRSACSVPEQRYANGAGQYAAPDRTCRPLREHCLPLGCILQTTRFYTSPSAPRLLIRHTHEPNSPCCREFFCNRATITTNHKLPSYLAGLPFRSRRGCRFLLKNCFLDYFLR